MHFLTLFVIICMNAAVQSQNIACTYRTDYNYDTIGTIYTCLVSGTAAITAPNQIVSTFTGTHLTSYGYNSDNQVLAFFVSGGTLNYIPKGIDAHFGNLKVLTVNNCALKRVEKSDIEKFTKLQYLGLPSNQIESLDENLFESNLLMTHVDFRNNNLKQIGTNILKPLTALTSAWFSANPCLTSVSSLDVSTNAEAMKLNVLFEQYCPTDSYLRMKYCNIERDQLNACNGNLDAATQKLYISQKQLHQAEELFDEMESAFKSANVKLQDQSKSKDGNLDAATRNLYISQKQLHQAEELIDEMQLALKTANVKFVQQPEEEPAVTVPKPGDAKLVCDDASDSKTCTAYNFKVEFEGSETKATYKNKTTFDTRAVRTLTIVDQEALYLPSDLFTSFPEITNMTIISSGLFEIDPKVFSKLKKLKTFNMSQNKLREIKSNSFNDQTALTSLDLSFNRIEILRKNAFKGLEKIETLKLNDNLMDRIDGKLVENMIAMKVFTLQNNKLKYISPILLAPFKLLVSADLSKNECIDDSFPKSTLAAIETKLTDNCVAPVDFNCNFRLIKSVIDGTTTNYICSPQNLKIVKPNTKISALLGKNVDGYGFSDVNMLMISNQVSEYIPFEIASVLQFLDTIVVEKSKLSKLQAKDFNGLNALKKIVLKGNEIVSISSDTFNDVPQLEHLDMTNNKIKELPFQVFASLNKLFFLDLSNNEMEKINGDIVSKRNVIKSFIVNNNQLEFIETKLLKVLRQASLIDFTENTCINQKFDETKKDGKDKLGLIGEVSLNCNLDDYEARGIPRMEIIKNER